MRDFMRQSSVVKIHIWIVNCRLEFKFNIEGLRFGFYSVFPNFSSIFQTISVVVVENYNQIMLQQWTLKILDLANHCKF